MRYRSTFLLISLLLINACQQAPLPEQRQFRITFADSAAMRSRYDPLIAAFQAENPDIAVQFVPLENTILTSTNASAIASAADTAIVALSDRIASNLFNDLQPLLDADTSFDGQTFWPGTLESCTIVGQRLGLPVAIQPTFIFFDAAAFDAAGQAWPQVGWTWEEFQATARAMSQRSANQTTRYGFVPNGSTLTLFAPLIDSILSNNPNPQAALTEALGWYSSLANEGIVPRQVSDFAALITQRKAALWVDTPLNLELWRRTLGDQVMLVPFPVAAIADTQQTTPVEPLCAVISAGSANPAAAWEWINFLSMQRLHNGWEIAPARSSVAESSGYWNSIDPTLQPAVQFALEHAWFERFDADRLNLVAAALDQVLAEEGDINSTLAQLALNDEPPAVLPTSAPIVVASPQATASADTVSIDYFGDSFLHPSQRILQELAEQFMRDNPSIRVEIYGSQALQPGTRTTYASQAERFDCFSAAGVPPPDQRASLYDLSPLLSADPAVTAADFNPDQLRILTAEGALYGLPLAISPLVINYNADYFEQMGLPAPSRDWTAADFERIALAAARGEGANRIYGFVPYQADGLNFLLALRGADAYDFSTQPPSTRFDQPAMLDAMTWIAQLISDGVILSPSGGITVAQYDDAVTSGRAAMWLGIAGVRGGFSSDQAPPFEIGVAPPPETGIPLPVVFPNSAYISRNAADPGACWKWITFLSSQPLALNGVPARQSVAASAAWEERVGAEQAAIYRTAAARPMLAGIVPSYYRQWLQQALAEAVAGRNLTLALNLAQQRADLYRNCLLTMGDNSAERQKECAMQVDPEIVR